MFVFSHKISFIKRAFRSQDWARIFVFLAFCAVALGVAVGAFALFYRGFRFFQRDVYFGDALTVYALESVFFVLIVLVFSSSLVTGLWTMFGSGENQFLLST